MIEMVIKCNSMWKKWQLDVISWQILQQQVERTQCTHEKKSSEWIEHHSLRPCPLLQ